MKRIELIYDKLKKLDSNSWISATEIAGEMGLARSNVCSDLNILCEEGKAEKKGTKPVLFKAVKSSIIENDKNIFDIFVEKNPSLFSAVEQAKAAVLYPPKGMHMLLLGETGVGKSMFASLIHKYAVEAKRMEENSPFIVFNCADYANNPQLLLSQLFGNVKGSYTGADSDRPGLIERADGGILFLDEVHRLPPEGQEMFFTFMDRGTYRRLGETDAERSAKVLIISATTESPDSTLLKTFTRRIPMIIHIPSLSERNIEERFNLINQFFMDESATLGKQILVSVNSMRAFLSYNCPNNVGQLKTDIQLACAKAYSDFISSKKDDIKISSMNLPPYIKKGLYMETDNRQVWNKLVGINKRYCIFDSNKENVLFREDENEKNIYDMIDLKLHELKGLGINDEKIEKEMGQNIDEYFAKYMYTVKKEISLENLKNVVGPEITRVVEEIIEFSQERLNKTLDKNIFYGMAIHISNSVDRVRKNRKIFNPQLNRIRTEYNQEFNIAVDCLKIIERVFDITMPIDEAGFLAMFLVYSDNVIKEQAKEVKVIVIAHGQSTATSMADTANKLLGENHAAGIDAPLDEKPQITLSKLKNYLKENDDESDILLLVDMGSLINFGEEIEKELNVNIKTIPMVSTLHVIEAVRKSMLGYKLDDVYKDTLNVSELMMSDQKDLKKVNNDKHKFSIVTMCTTGEGSAAVIKDMLEKELEFDSSIFKIESLNIVGKDNIYKKLIDIENCSRILCIVSPFSIDKDVKQFDLDDILNNKAIKSIQELIDAETIYIKMGDTLENSLENIEGESALKDIKIFTNNIEENLNIKFSTNTLIGITLHIGCMLDRLVENGTVEEFEGKDQYISQNQKLYKYISRECKILNTKYDIHISDSEICNIMMLFTAH